MCSLGRPSSVVLDETVVVTMSSPQMGTGRPLTSREIEVLEVLADRPGEVVAKAEILDRVWGAGAGGPNLVEVYVGRLRRKLQDDDGLDIQTVRGVGYRLARARQTPSSSTRTLSAWTS